MNYYYEVTYLDDDHVTHRACVNAANVSEAVATVLHLDPSLRGKVNNIKTCTRITL